MKIKDVKYRQVSESYFVTDALTFGEVKEIFNSIPDNYTLLSGEEVTQSNGLDKGTSYTTYLSIIEIDVDDERKEVKFFTKRAKLKLVE